jgi:hypothetical protein
MAVVIPASDAGRSGTLICVGDPQYSVTNQKPLFEMQITWIIQNPPDIVLVMGDCTDDDSAASWTFFAAQMARLTAASIPWMISTGNHDYDSATGQIGLHPLRTTNMNASLNPPAGATLYQPGHLENSYALLTLGGVTYCVVMLEWSPRTAVVAWANSILAAHSDKPAIVVTHAYLYTDGTRFDQALYGPEGQGAAGPHAAKYQTSPEQGIYDGQELWDALVNPNSNVRLVLSGHVDVAARRNDVRLDGSHCIQILTDYQSEEWFGNGWLVSYDIDHSNRVVTARSLTPFERKTRTVRAHAFRESF